MARRALVPLGVVFLATGFSTAFVYPFLSLFLSTEVRAGPVATARTGPPWVSAR